MAERTDTYAATRPVPYLLGVLAAQTITCPVRYGSAGALVAPTSGTITITRADGTVFASAAAVTITSSVATYALGSTLAESIGEGWSIVWALLINGNVYSFQFSAYICGYVPQCSVAVSDLYRYEPELKARVPQAQAAAARGGSGEGWQPQVDDAYYALIQWMLDGGHRPWLVRDMTGTREWLRTLALMRCCRALSTAAGDLWAGKATDYRYEHKSAMAGLKLQYTSDAVGTARGVSPVIRLAPVGRPCF